jgi:sulfotransferase
MKTYHFLAGLPRSGNTLLSAILNQNPKIYSSPLSPVSQFLWDCDQTITNNENAIRLNNKEPLINIGKNILQNYYADIKQNIIIDREKAWATEANMQIIKKYITDKPKIIFTVRPIIEILTSFINISPEESFIDIEMKNNNWWYKNYLTKNDNRCDYLMRPWGQIDKTIFSINEIIKSENKDMFCVIKYDEIMNAPKQTMDKIYNFLELPNYKHNFNNIKKVEQDNDEALGQPVNLHKIRPQLKKVSKDPKEVLSEYVINKYSDMGFVL